MVKQLCIMLAVLLIAVSVAGCHNDTFWCDYCQKWYHDGSSHSVLEGTVDFMLCDDCYIAYLSNNTNETEPNDTLP